MDSIGKTISEDFDQTCKCHFSSDFILFNQPHCLTAHPDWLIVWGTIVGTNSANSSAILRLLQVWVEKESAITVEGVPLTTLPDCSVILRDGEPPFCESTTESTSETEGVQNNNSSQSGLSVPYIVIIVLVVLIIVIAVFAIVVVCKKRKKPTQTRCDTLHSITVLSIISYVDFTLCLHIDIFTLTAAFEHWETILECIQSVICILYWEKHSYSYLFLTHL